MFSSSFQPFHSSVGLPRSLGDGFDDSFVSDGGLGGIGEGDVGYVRTYILLCVYF